jgi:hypothetical protein
MEAIEAIYFPPAEARTITAVAEERIWFGGRALQWPRPLGVKRSWVQIPPARFTEGVAPHRLAEPTAPRRDATSGRKCVHERCTSRLWCLSAPHGKARTVRVSTPREVEPRLVVETPFPPRVAEIPEEDVRTEPLHRVGDADRRRVRCRGGRRRAAADGGS